MIGRALAHYRVLEELGSGGMGRVYLAEDTRLDRRVALKVLPPGMASDPERLERFAREARAIGGLNHPNIVTIYSVEEVESLHLLVMELVEGQTLSEEIPAGGLPEERFFELAIPLADALSAAHQRGVTHRDLKPSNVMVTGDGRVKVVDFGLAKLRQETQAWERTAVLDQELTEEGRILGTYPYMSPEQIKGKPIDHRSDIFSLGVVLYEMATGERPFSGETSADLVSSILRDDPPPAYELNQDLPRHLDRILAHCLEKDPDRRFQTAKDLRNELRSLRDEIRSERLLRGGSVVRRWVGSGASPGRRRIALSAGLGALVLALSITAALLLNARGADAPTRAGSPPLEAAAGARRAEERASVAVLFFQNLTGDADLAWLRIGITEMLVTDLSQSPGLRVVPTDRLYEILNDLDRLDEPVVSADLVRRVAERAGVATVVLGSYARAGENLLVNLTLQDVESGEILEAQRLQGAGESSVFAIVDGLSRSVRQAFERSGRVATTERPGLEGGIESVTTSSVEAYRLYAEGTHLVNEIKLEEALPLFERAVELDPGFAMAYVRLARVFEILGREEEVRRNLEQAYTHADRLPPRERLYVEGSYFSHQRATYGRAIQNLERAVDLYPDHHVARHQLGLLYCYVELFQRAEEQFQELLERGHRRDAVYNAVAHAQGSQGRIEPARRLLEGWVDEEPARWSRRLVLAWHAINWGDVETAADALERVERARTGSSFVGFFQWRLGVLQGDRDLAAAAAGRLVRNGDRFWRWQGLTAQALLALYRGDPAEALERLEESTDEYGSEHVLTGAGRNWAARILLDRGRPDEALAQSEASRRVAPDDWPGWEGLFLSALAQERLGRSAEADRLAAELAGIAEGLPGNVEERLHHRLLGLLAMERGQRAAALAELERAAAMLPPRGLPWHRHRVPDHGAIWYELATVYQALGRSADALEHYRRVVESGTERTFHPLQYVRSHYFLGRLLEERGDREGAREVYRAFVDFWGDGELDRERLEDARARLAALGG